MEESPIDIGHIIDKVLIFVGAWKIFADTCKNNGFTSKVVEYNPQPLEK